MEPLLRSFYFLFCIQQYCICKQSDLDTILTGGFRQVLFTTKYLGICWDMFLCDLYVYLSTKEIEITSCMSQSRSQLVWCFVSGILVCLAISPNSWTLKTYSVNSIYICIILINEQNSKPQTKTPKLPIQFHLLIKPDISFGPFFAALQGRILGTPQWWMGNIPRSPRNKKMLNGGDAQRKMSFVVCVYSEQIILGQLTWHIPKNNGLVRILFHKFTTIQIGYVNVIHSNGWCGKRLFCRVSPESLVKLVPGLPDQLCRSFQVGDQKVGSTMIKKTLATSPTTWNH